MAELTGLFGIDWATVFFVLFGISIAAMSLRRDVTGFRVGPFLLVPLVSGVLLVVAVAVSGVTDIRRFSPFQTRPITFAFVVAAAIVALAITDLLFTRIVRFLTTIWGGHGRSWVADANLVIVVGGAALVAGSR